MSLMAKWKKRNRIDGHDTPARTEAWHFLEKIDAIERSTIASSMNGPAFMEKGIIIGRNSTRI